MTNEEIWLKNYELAKKCYQIYGNLLIPKNFIMKDENGDDFNIGVWLQKQRTAYYNGYLNNNHIRMLEEINMVWNIKETNEIILKNWLKRYEIAREYYKANGNLLVPQNYIVIDEDGKKANLTNWIAMQRKRYNKKN